MADFDPDTYLAEKTAALQQAAQAPAAPSQGFDPDTYLAQKQAAIQQAANPQRMPANQLAQPGVLESLGRGAEQGATMGFGDELNGALSAIAQKAGEHSDENLTDLYTKNRDESRAAMKAAESAHPLVYGAGNIAGGLGTALATAGTGLAGEGVLGAAKAGGAIGAISGLGNSESNTLPGMASDTLKGAAFGAGTGLGIGAIGKGLAAASDLGAAPKLIGAFSQGANKGRTLFGKAGAQAVHNEGNAALSDISDTIQNNLNTASAAKQASQEATPDKVNITDYLKGIITGAKNSLQTHPYDDDQADIRKILGVITKFTDVNGTGDVDAVALEGLKRKLGVMGTEGDAPLNTSAGKAFANHIMMASDETTPTSIQKSFGFPDDFTGVKPILNDHIEGLDQLNQRIHQLRTASDMIPEMSTVANAQDTTTSGFNSQDKLNDFYNTLPQDVKAQVQPKLQDIGQAQNLTSKLQTGGLAPGLLSQNASSEPYAWANAAGLAVRPVVKAAQAVKGVIAAVKPTAASTLRDMAPEELGSLANNLKASGNDVGAKLGSVLDQASQRDQAGRNAILFTIEQNPIYRDALSKVTGKPALPNQ